MQQTSKVMSSQSRNFQGNTRDASRRSQNQREERSEIMRPMSTEPQSAKSQRQRVSRAIKQVQSWRLVLQIT